MKQVIYFSAKWCNACQSMTPIIDSLKKQNPNNIAKIDVDYDVSLVEQYNIRSVPTTVILENGIEVDRHVGTLNDSQLKKLING